MKTIAASLLAIGLATATQAFASERGVSGGAPVATRTFTPEDFAVFAPRTALDMVRQIPGFSINSGDDGARGLGQADQNILLNGKRVSGKSNDAITTLSRIEASSVLRIELLEGASLDIPGLSGEVANIVYKVDSFGGTFEWRPQFRERLDDNWFAGEVALSGKLGGFDWTASLANDAFRRGNFGLEIVEDAGGNLILTRDELSTFYGDRPRLTLGASRTAASGNIFNINAVGEIFWFDRIETGFEQIVDGVSGDRRSERAQDQWSVEIGGDYEFGLGTGRMKVIGLYGFEREPSINDFIYLARIPDAADEGRRFEQDSDVTEIIGRAEYGWAAWGGDWQVSIEGAYNKLDSEGRLFVRDALGVLQPVDFGGATATIDEKRAEGFVSHSRELGGGLAMQANLGGEYSQIDAGAADGARSFWRPKGSLVLDWAASRDLTLSARFERTVDQLDFGQFLASVDVTDDLGRDQNVALVPPQRWTAELEAVAALGDYGSLRPFIRASVIEDVIEIIPVGIDGEVLGNVDAARIWSLGSNGTLLFDPFGWTGARLDFELAFSGSSIEDPLTGANRELSGRELIDVEADLRHDIPGSDIAWGGGFSFRETAKEVRLGNIDNRYDTGPDIYAFAEHKDVAGLTVRLRIGNLLDRRDGFERLLWDGRRIGPYGIRESRERRFGRTIEFSVRGTI
ncbi:TonB-dependent receptor plug domain-containing protein [Sphingomicrobium marinum]|uniref:TonB-dependent receptor plug domain-containing protein n=1 Tax=Sphingomicrobium marinum TaxID=1227950 RepID=UPI00223F33EA|nr:TonB-dependent receptor plug domain-containing protein [Sphingomicrobium marinum]